MLTDQIGEGPARDARERFREHDVAEIAVAECPDVLPERLLRRAPHRFVQALRVAPEREPPRQAAGVGEHLLQRDAVLLSPMEVGDERAERHRQVDEALAHEREHKRGGRELRERREVEQRFRGARRVRACLGVGAERAQRERLALAAPFDPYHARRAQRSDRGACDGARGFREAHGIRTGSWPVAVLSPASTAASASRDTGTSQ